MEILEKKDIEIEENLHVVKDVVENGNSDAEINKEKIEYNITSITTLGLYSGNDKPLLISKEEAQLRTILMKIYESGATLEIYYDKGVL